MEQGRLMKLSLVVLSPGKGEGKVIPITLSQFIIGRDPDCNLRPASPVISKRHCAVLIRDQQAFVRDFDSTNGTFVNEEPVKGEVELHEGDQLKCGPLTFAVKLEVGAPSVSQPTPAAAKAPAAKPAAKTAAKPAAKAAAPAASGGDEDDSAADLLLSLGDEGTGEMPEIPEGSTIMDIPLPAQGGDAAGKKDDKMGQAKAQQASTSNAAKAILDKYMRRPRA
jgi:predicted component of type VI protein secretion system